MGMNDQLAAGLSPSMPTITNVYDAHAGHYNDRACCPPPAPASMPLPGTPSPFANLKAIK